ncbi:MAG: DUF6703 family protein [Micromonosporaceae bacterium]
MAAHPPRRRPLPKGETFFTPDATGLRREVERRSAGPLVFLHQLPGWAVPLAFVAVLVTGLAVKGWIGAAALAVVTASLGWFSYLSWPSLEAPGRMLRAATIIALIVLVIIQGTR